MDPGRIRTASGAEVEATESGPGAAEWAPSPGRSNRLSDTVQAYHLRAWKGLSRSDPTPALASKRTLEEVSGLTPMNGEG